MPRRNHHLRERRLKLGATQELIGCLAGWSPRRAQSYVSAIENGRTTARDKIRRVRSAIVYLELEPRRRREWERREATEAEVVEAAVLLNREEVITERLVDLLYDGRSEDFDRLAERVSPEIVERAGDLYIDGITPCLE
jgi:transcriptional regulator with XRE-family HTH domain